MVGCDVGHGDDSHWTGLLICVAQVPLDDLSDIDWVMVYYNVGEAKSANASLDSCPGPTLTPYPMRVIREKMIIPRLWILCLVYYC